MRVIETGAAPAHTGPVPQAVEVGGWIYVSALFGADPTTHAIPADARHGVANARADLLGALDRGGRHGFEGVDRADDALEGVQRFLSDASVPDHDDADHPLVDYSTTLRPASSDQLAAAMSSGRAAAGASPNRPAM